MEEDEFSLGADTSGFADARGISVNTTVNGSLPTSSTENYYKFTLPRAGYIYVEFNHGYVDRDSDFWNFSIYNGSYEYITDRSSNGKKLTTTYHSVGLAAGTYYIKINPGYYWSDISYNFVVHFVASNSWEKEKNDSFESANVFGTNIAVCGSIQESNDLDFYKFEVPQDGMAYIEFNHEYVDSDWDFWNIRIYNQDFEELMSRNASGKKLNRIYGKLGIPAGTYYIRIMEIRSWQVYWSEASYNFIFHTEASNAWEKERNESFQTANALAVNSNVNGSIREDSDKDFYRFEISQAGYVNFDFGHTYVDSDRNYWNITIFNGSYEELISRDADGKTLNRSYAVVGVPAGIYYVRVTKSYWSDAAYNLKVNYTPASDWETELNENFETSDFISMDTYVNGSIKDDNDKDYYKLDVQRPGFISIAFGHDVVNSDNSLWKVRLYDASFQELKVASCTGKSDLVTSPYFAAAGTYYVRINGDWHWSDVPYHFKVTYNFTDSTPWISASVTGKQQVKLSWSGVSNASGYEIYRAVGKGGKYTLLKTIANGNTQSYTDKNVTLGKTYSYKVRGYYADGGGTLYSDFSSKKTVKVALAKVKISKAKSLSSKRVQIVWKKVSGASGYEVYRSKTKNGKYKKIGTLKSWNKVSFTDKKVSRKKTYYYKVRAYKKVRGKKYYGEYSGKKKVRVK
ncbi:hypothetical protein D7Y06_14900 [Roseburia sp. 1XD42-69]|nr:hypothetical protein D7Y06_14900 [Roseburia sp. 1XD42-69]